MHSSRRLGASMSDDALDSVYRYHETFAGPSRTFVRKSFVCAVRLSPYAEGRTPRAVRQRPYTKEPRLPRQPGLFRMPRCQRATTICPVIRTRSRSTARPSPSCH